MWPHPYRSFALPTMGPVKKSPAIKRFNKFCNTWQQVSWKTRKYLWKTKRQQPPSPVSKGYWLSRMCPCFGKSPSGCRNCRKAHLHDKILSFLCGTMSIRPLVKNSLEKLIFRKKEVLRSFSLIRPISKNLMWPKLPKGTSTRHDFHLCPLQHLFNHPLQRSTLEKLMFRKTAVFEHFGLIRHFRRSNLAQTTHLHTKKFHLSRFPGLYDHPLPRYSLEKKSMTDGRTDGRTDTPNL